MKLEIGVLSMSLLIFLNSTSLEKLEIVITGFPTQISATICNTWEVSYQNIAVAKVFKFAGKSPIRASLIVFGQRCSKRPALGIQAITAFVSFPNNSFSLSVGYEAVGDNLLKLFVIMGPSSAI